LVRISFQGEATGTAPIPPPAISSRASRVNSTAPSLNGRSISGARWNSHYLVPRATTSTTLDSTPIATFNAPDWVFVTADGPQVVGIAQIASATASVGKITPPCSRRAFLTISVSIQRQFRQELVRAFSVCL